MPNYKSLMCLSASRNLLVQRNGVWLANIKALVLQREIGSHVQDQYGRYEQITSRIVTDLRQKIAIGDWLIDQGADVTYVCISSPGIADEYQIVECQVQRTTSTGSNKRP